MSYSESDNISRHLIVKKEQIIRLFELFLDKEQKTGNVTCESNITATVTFSDSSRRELKDVNDLKRIETSKEKKIDSILYTYNGNGLYCSVWLNRNPQIIGRNIEWKASGTEEDVVIIMRNIKDILNKDSDILMKLISIPSLIYWIIFALSYRLTDTQLFFSKSTSSGLDIFFSLIFLLMLIILVKAAIGKVIFIWGDEDIRYKNITSCIALAAYILSIAIPILIS